MPVSAPRYTLPPPRWCARAICERSSHASLEAGNAWDDRSQLSLAHLRSGGSVYLGADTGIGPMYLGITYAPRGELGIALFIGRP